MSHEVIEVEEIQPIVRNMRRIVFRENREPDDKRDLENLLTLLQNKLDRDTTYVGVFHEKD